MDQSARIKSPRAQRLAVTVAMTLVFAAVMGLAYLTAAVRGAPGAEAFASPLEVRLEGLTVTVPGEWSEDASAARELGIERGLVLRDPARPQRWLMVRLTRQPRPISPREQMANELATLLGPEYDRLLQPLMPERAHRRGDLLVVQNVAASPPPRGLGEQLHLLATLTTDGERHWLIYVTDRIDPGEPADAAVRRNMALFQRIEQSAQLEG